MCGIAGIVGEVDSIEHRLAKMSRAQSHRGRRDKGFWVSSFVDAQLGMAHNSMIISETEELVRQPFVDEETALVVALDGDIYNFRDLRKLLSRYYVFTTDSSVEVVAKAFHRWGDECLRRFEGSFAIAIYDRSADMLMLARDRFGVKPLYYATQRGNLFFASEVRTLFAAGVRKQISAERWAGYMVYSSYGLPYETFWEGIHQLPAGFLLQYNGYSLREKSWYNLSDEVRSLVESRDAFRLGELLLDELERCTEKCLSDVSTCGFRIAGRIESQLLHAIAIQGVYEERVHAFTGILSNFSRESGGEKGVAEQVWVTSVQAIDELERMLYWVEEPFDGTESVVRTTMFRQAGRGGTHVLCSGVGLDAMWQDGWDKSEVRYDYLFTSDWFSPYFVSLAVRPQYPHPFAKENDNMRYLDLCCERIPHILRFFDKSSVAAGVQVRLPFLNNTLVALSFALPMVSDKNRRELFDDCVRRRYDASYNRQEEQSLMPIWLGGGMKEWVGDALADLRRSSVREWFDAGAVERSWRNFGEGEPMDLALLWKILSLRQQLYGEDV